MTINVFVTRKHIAVTEQAVKPGSMRRTTTTGVNRAKRRSDKLLHWT